MSKYKKVSIDIILKFKKLPCDVYVRLSEKKYTKVIKASGLYESSIIHKLKEKNILYLHVFEDDYALLTKFIQKAFAASLAGLGKAGSKNIGLQIDAAKLIADKIRFVEVDDETVQVVNSTVESCISSALKTSDVSGLLKSMIKRQDYIYTHSVMIIYIAVLMSKEMKWEGETTLKKISQAALFHDIIFEDENLARLEYFESEDKDELSEEDTQIIKMHAINASECIKTMQGLQPDVAKIIQDHHEMPNGKGFPRGLFGTQMTQISCLFNLAEAFVNRIYDSDQSTGEVVIIMKELEVNYDTGNFKGPFKALKSLINFK